MAKKVDHEERRREIVAKALRLFSKVGYDNVSLIMIAASCGVSRTILYRYFCSKREVMDAAISSVIEKIEVRCSLLMRDRERAAVRLERVCHAVAEEMYANREFLTAVFDFVVGMVRTGSDMNKGISDYTSGTRNAIKRLIAIGKREGDFPDILIEERTTDALYAEFESCAMRIVLGTERTADQAKVRFSDVVHALSLWK